MTRDCTQITLTLKEGHKMEMGLTSLNFENGLKNFNVCETGNLQSV